ncbi:hypothetical protein CGMCC3_g15841 [Colletotrichum fructicola]|nr:uncharacterized protein CGMCC3_g15841 [Colletotrichum fructicola]KAE9568014.1 hypothetical protein CGMCC3_g15841 [Colletotrichum fructicola]
MDFKKYFLERWPFQNERARLYFAAEELPTWWCCQYPSCSPGRVTAACHCLEMFFLVNDLLGHMTSEEGSSYIEKLSSIITCEVAPTEGEAIEKVVYDVWKRIAVIDDILAREVMELMQNFWRSHTNNKSLEGRRIAGLLECQDQADGSRIVMALDRLVKGVHLSQEEAHSVAGIEFLFARHAAALNDLASWEEDRHTERDIDAPAFIPRNLVQVLSDELDVSSRCAENVLSEICQGWVEKMDHLVVERIEEGCSDSLREYLNFFTTPTCKSKPEDFY